MRILFLLMCLASPALAEVSGPLRVIDGDTFDVGGERIRLFGVDAPETGQPCVTEAGPIDCGDWVATRIAARFGGQQTVCEGRERDRYDRLVASCTIGDADLGREIVSAGWARAFLFYSEEYAADEKGAAIARRGIWSFDSIDPATYRAKRIAAPAPTGPCTIKGNITENGHIYHMSHNRDYGRTRINLERGERWFCTEAEALAAGWRAARN